MSLCDSQCNAATSSSAHVAVAASGPCSPDCLNAALAAARFQAGWETAHAVSTKDLEVMYDAGRNTQLLPASIIEQAERSCGAPVRYMIATATLGL